ncbi:MAG TPA: DoxX family membrane protein [Candidatus Saccharimonadales bacterium]|nr:DoxX family membrane protein [Candidatus Saccharimonadales bacterium]
MTKDRVAAASWILRLGLAFVLAYAAISGIIHPSHWVSYLPRLATEHLNANSLLKIFEVYELILAAWLILGWRVKYAAILMALTMIGAVLADTRAFETTFRDIAIACAAAALFVLEN